ncbi:MAG: diadenylate cyclase CdaA [Pseudomonadota bacterium]
MQLFAIIANLRFQDVLDVLFLTAVAYHLFLWFRGTKAFKALVGLLALGIVFTLAQTWGLFLTTWMFQIFWQVLVILLIILFQSEIRQVLERVNPLQAIGLNRYPKPGKWVSDFCKASFELSKREIGCLVIIERTDRVEEWITGGQELEAEPTPEILLSIFQKNSPLHDGAIVIREGRIVQVACYLPLSSAEGLPPEWGTRHRAAMGLTERCDALILAVSEERGEVSLARDGELKPVVSPQSLSELVFNSLKPIGRDKTPWQKRAQALVLNRWPAKLGTLALVSILWLLLAGQQDFEKTLILPLEIKNLPANMEILEPMTPRIQVKVRGLRKDASTLSEKNVRGEMDVSQAGMGKRVFPINRDHIFLPNERLYIVDIAPPQIQFQFRARPQSSEHPAS